MTYEEEKTYTIEGRTLDEIKDKLYSKYGSDYRIIKKTTDFRPAGLFGLSQKEVQIVKYKINHKTYETNNLSSVNQSYPSVFADGYVKQDNAQEEFEKNRKAILEVISKQNSNNLENSDILKQLGNQMEEITKMVSSMQTNMNNNSNNYDLHPTITKIENILTENEFTFPYIKMIIEKIKKEFPLEQLEDFKLVQRYVVDWIGETISISKDKIVRPPHVIIIVGPTGVGKTTTIAKLASKSLLYAKENNLIKPELCILTTDTMRVGALEQLAKYGELLGKNVQKAESMNDVKQLYEEYKDHVDYIFIDTGGYSPNDVEKIGSTKNLLDVDMKADVHLAIAATTKASDVQTIIRNYEPLAYDSIIITKCDETKCFGNIISVLWEKHKSFSYLTDGQRVPRCISKANVVDILLKLHGFDIDRVHIENVFGEQ